MAKLAATERRARLAVIGPLLPFRSGIAHHTTRLVRALAPRADLMVTSFSRQYPALLFPGESDRDPEAAREPGVSYDIDSLNPCTWWRAAGRVNAFRPDALVLPWWTFLWTPCFWYLARTARKQGIQVLFLCHNVVDHEETWWKAWAAQIVLAQGTSFLVHSAQGAELLRRLFPGRRVLLHPMPIFDHFPAPSIALPRRADLELLYFGIVRPYKGLDVLIDALALLHGMSVHLTVAGEFWSGHSELKSQIRRLGLDERVEILPRYVADAEAANLFARADVIVLPYRSATGSGVIANAYHYRKPVIVTRVGGLPDVVSEGETGWVVPPEDPAALAARIRSLSAEHTSAMGASVSELTNRMSWDSLADCLLRAVSKRSNQEI